MIKDTRESGTIKSVRQLSGAEDNQNKYWKFKVQASYKAITFIMWNDKIQTKKKKKKFSSFVQLYMTQVFQPETQMI